MTGRSSLLVAVLAVAVLGLAIGLVIAVGGATASAPIEADPSTSPRPTTGAPHAAIREATGAPGVPAPRAGGYTKFVSPAGIEAKPFGTDPALRTPIPAGGFASWSGREGTWPGEIEAFAEAAGLNLAVALEQRRSTLLSDLTADTDYLGELLGAPPTGEMIGAIDDHASALHHATALIQVRAREGTLSDAAAVQETRAAEDAYQRGYREATGISEAQFDRFFSPDRPLP